MFHRQFNTTVWTTRLTKPLNILSNHWADWLQDNNIQNSYCMWPCIASEFCFPSTRPGTRFTDGSAGGLEVLWCLFPSCPSGKGKRHHMWAHVHASCFDHSRMLLQDVCPGFRRYHHASTSPRTCLVHRNPGTYVSILTAGSASPPCTFMVWNSS